MSEKIKRGVAQNRGTAIILSLIIVTVLFILTSFLIRKVVTNTMMVRKAGEEQEGYALAKQGILYALDQLNTSEGYSPDYDSTDWPGTGNRNWIELDLDNKDEDNDVTTGDKECRIRVDKDDLPPNVFVSPDPNDDSNYLTIESQDLPKKLVTLEAITENSSPLLSYVRFINSDTVFGNDFFGQTGTLIQGDAPLCILGNVTWASASSNNLILNGYDSKAIIYGTISNGGVTNLQINGNSPQSDYYYFFDPDDPSYDDASLFDTADGHYFSSAHLPSCYDYSGGTPSFYDGSTQGTFWPQINEERYANLAHLVVSASHCGNRGAAWNDWYPSNGKYAGGYASGEYWREEGSGTSYNYTPPGVHLIFSATQDLDSSIPAAQNLLRINDSSGTDTPAEYESSATASSFSENVIFAEKDVRINGVLPRNLSIASGGNIYIDSNIYTNGYSLALLANENVLLNTTHRWVAGYEGGDNWNYNGTSAANLIGVTDTGFARAQVNIGESEEQILDFGGSTFRQIVTTDRIILRGCAYEVFTDKTLDLSVDVDLGDGDWQPTSFVSGPAFPIYGPPPGSSSEVVFETPSTFRSFSRIKLTATGGGTGIDPAGWIEINAVEIPTRDMDGMAILAENGSWYLISGNGTSPNNDQQESFSLSVALSEQELEKMSKWNDGSGFGEADFNQIAYTFDADLVTVPPPALPPSVNLVSLKRKGEG